MLPLVVVPRPAGRTSIPIEPGELCRDSVTITVRADGMISFDGEHRYVSPLAGTPVKAQFVVQTDASARTLTLSGPVTFQSALMVGKGQVYGIQESPGTAETLSTPRLTTLGPPADAARMAVVRAA